MSHYEKMSEHPLANGDKLLHSSVTSYYSSVMHMGVMSSVVGMCASPLQGSRRIQEWMS